MLSIPPGTTIAGYHIEREIDRGRAAIVYQAYDPAHHRPVVFKVLHARSAGHPDLVARLRRELTAEPPLCTHPHIARVYAVGQVHGFPFLASELVEGVSLEQRLAVPLAPVTVLRIATALAQALDAVHAVGLVHGAVSPASVLLGHDGSILLADFGVAPLLAALRPFDWHVMLAVESAYLGAETAQEGTPSAAGDRYALAMLTARMLGGPRTLDVPSTAGSAALVAASPPPVQAVLGQALAPDPAQRFPTCAAFCHALSRAFGPDAGAATTGGLSVEALVADVRDLLAAGDLDGAARALAAAQPWLAGEPRLVALANLLDQERRLAERYALAQRLVAAREWIAAREVLLSIDRERPDYRDVRALLSAAFDGLKRHWGVQRRWSGRPDAPADLRARRPAVDGDNHPLVAARRRLQRPRGTAQPSASADREPQVQDAHPTLAAGLGDDAEGGPPTEPAKLPAEATSPSAAGRTRLQRARASTYGERSAAAGDATTRRWRVDGRLVLTAQLDGVYLTAWPPLHGGRAATWHVLEAELAHWPPLALERAQVERVLREARGLAVPIAKPTWRALPLGPGAVGVALDDDEMAAYLIALGTLRYGALDERAVLEALAAAGVRHGILRSAVSAFCGAPERPRPAIVARGTPPVVAGAAPELLFADDEGAPLDVLPGAVLAWARTPEAVCGCTVTGRPVPPPDVPARPLSAYVGRGTALEERSDVPGGLAIVATVAGRPTLVGGRIAVLRHEHVREPLHGRAVFEGSVTLAAVEPGAAIHAGGDVVVEADARDVVIEAGGSVHLRSVEGGGAARIRAGGDVLATALRGCLLLCGSTVQVGDELTQSSVLAARRVRLGSAGVMNGGLVRATEEVSAPRIRAGNGPTPTRIILGRLARGPLGSTGARLVVKDELEPNVQVSIDGATLRADTPIRRAVLRQRHGIVCIEPLAS